MRLTKIEDLNLNLFEFDYDLTFMMFFMNANEKIYARYGGRCEQGPEERLSLKGLRSTMESVLIEHKKKEPRFATVPKKRPLFIREIAPPVGLGRCIHCHQAKEVIYDRLDRQGKWDTNLAFRFPLPDNLGIKLDVDRGNVIEEVSAESPAAAIGLKKGDRLTTLNNVPVHSFADAQFALDRAPKQGTIKVSWEHNQKVINGKLKLPENWRRTDISWRPSLRQFVAKAQVYGKNLPEDEKNDLGLLPKQLAFRQNQKLQDQAREAGVKPGDIIYGVDDKLIETNAYGFLTYIRGNYLKGETVTLNIIRNKQRKKIRMKLK